eukprot:Trichotokara_eunicae@DN5094_c0_g1_i12.p1
MVSQSFSHMVPLTSLDQLYKQRTDRQTDRPWANAKPNGSTTINPNTQQKRIVIFPLASNDALGRDRQTDTKKAQRTKKEQTRVKSQHGSHLPKIISSNQLTFKEVYDIYKSKQLSSIPH